MSDTPTAVRYCGRVTIAIIERAEHYDIRIRKTDGGVALCRTVLPLSNGGQSTFHLVAAQGLERVRQDGLLPFGYCESNERGFVITTEPTPSTFAVLQDSPTEVYLIVRDLVVHAHRVWSSFENQWVVVNYWKPRVTGAEILLPSRSVTNAGDIALDAKGNLGEADGADGLDKVILDAVRIVKPSGWALVGGAR